MANKYDVTIYMRNIQLEVVIPEKHVWEFMAEFGREFAKDGFDGSRHIRAVDGYYEHPAGWHIQISVGENYESRFYEFLRNFCLARSLSFREPEV